VTRPTTEPPASTMTHRRPVHGASCQARAARTPPARPTTETSDEGEPHSPPIPAPISTWNRPNRMKRPAQICPAVTAWRVARSVLV
jgi:hypothetical protein